MNYLHFQIKKTRYIFNIFLSYSIVYSQDLKLYFTNCILEYSDKKLIKYAPRDVFDKYNNFKKSNKKLYLIMLIYPKNL